MSKINLNGEVAHIPNFNEFYTSQSELCNKLYEAGIVVPLGFLDQYYYYTDLEGWGKVLFNLAFKSSLYKKDRFDCDNYAIKAMSIVQERYGLNTFGVVLGDTPEGYHAFNLFFHGDGIKLWEPNAGFEWGGDIFDIGEHGYIPQEIII